jgi:hypothetical protein
MPAPKDLKNSRIAPMPVDKNTRTPAGLIAPLVDGDGNVIGWAPVSTTDNGDGTVKLKVDADISADGLTLKADEFKSRSDTYTTATAGIAIDTSAFPLKYFSIQVKGTGDTADAWNIVLEGSLDGTNYQDIADHTTDVGDGGIVWSSANPAPVRYFRSRVDSITLGMASDVVVTILGVR